MNSLTEQKKVVLIEGDGIGPEISEAVLFILDKAGAKIKWETHLAGIRALESSGDSLPESTVAAVKSAGVALKGPVTTPIGKNPVSGKSFSSVNVGLRKALDLYANYRPIKSLPGVKSRYSDIDLVFIRENTEGLYAGLEQEIVPGVVTSLKVSTRVACLRIAEFAFAFAERAGRKKITGVHKANIMKLSDGLAIECYREVANQHPTIEYDEKIIDATAMALVLKPEQFDTLLMENLYGDILSDLGAGLIGGLGLAPSGNFGTQGAMFEAVHGSAPDIAGKGIANPTALLLSSVEMLNYLGMQQMGKAIERSVFKVFTDGKVLTPDLGGKAGTMEFAKAVVANL